MSKPFSHRLFISRALSPDSPVYAFAQAQDLEVFAQSLITFLPVMFDRLPSVEWVFFSSPRGVRFFFRQLREKGQSLPRAVGIAVLGDGTAKALKEFGRSPDFSGNGQPDWVAEAFAELAAGKRVLFPRASNSRKSIQKSLESRIVPIDLVVYDNQPKGQIDIPDCRILLFTSPMNVQAWARKHNFRATEQLIVAIGQTTAHQLAHYGVEARIAEQPSESGLVRTLKGMSG